MKKSVFEEILNLQREVIRLMNEMSNFPSRSLKTARNGDNHWQPNCDIYRCQDKLYIIFDICGIDRESIKIRTSPDYLIISGERNLPVGGKNPSYYTMEIDSGHFERVVYFPERPLNSDKPEVNYDNGILRIIFDLPKKEKKLYEIEVN